VDAQADSAPFAVTYSRLHKGIRHFVITRFKPVITNAKKSAISRLPAQFCLNPQESGAYTDREFQQDGTGP
jgi:hypothetical protein